MDIFYLFESGCWAVDGETPCNFPTNQTSPTAIGNVNRIQDGGLNLLERAAIFFFLIDNSHTNNRVVR